MIEEPDGIRCFVGVPIGNQLRIELAAAADDLRGHALAGADALRWTDPSGWHLSLAFLGSVGPGAIGGIVTALTSVAGEHAQFAVPSAGLGAFPSRREVRVLWYGLVDRSRRLAELAVATREAVGMDRSAPFRAHITLARAAGDRGLAVPPALWKTVMPSGEVRVDRLILYRSHLGDGPARYEALAEMPLGITSPSRSSANLPDQAPTAAPEVGR